MAGANMTEAAMILDHPSPYTPGRFGGRGIVICAGGPRYFTCAFVLLSLLRRVFSCDLPVQIWHLGASELSPAMRKLLTSFDAEMVDAAACLEHHPAVIHNGWALKPYAIAHSRFAEVLSLDADIVPLVAPQAVFDWPQYREHGALFWPDQVDLAVENPVWAALGLPARRCTSFESGQLVIDKSRCWEALATTIALNNQSAQLYQMLYGDKDTFLLAFLRHGQPYHLIAHSPLLFDSDLIQRDPAGAPFIHHRTMSKYQLAGPNRPVFGDTLTGAMEAALADLRARWTGIMFHPPAMSQAAQVAARGLAGKKFIYQSSATAPRVMVLDDDFQVGEGAAEFERHWALIERDGKLVLQLYSATRLSLELMPMPDGSWSGSASTVLGFSARLVGQDEAATMPYSGAVQVAPTSACLVHAMLTASAIGAGFDEVVSGEVDAALSLLNRSYHDVPEALKNWLAAQPGLSDLWQAALQTCQTRLQTLRDARLRDTAFIAAPMNVLAPGFYDRNL